MELGKCTSKPILPKIYLLVHFLKALFQQTEFLRNSEIPNLSPLMMHDLDVQSFNTRFTPSITDIK